MIERVQRVFLRRGATFDVIEDSLQTTALHVLARSQGFNSFDGMVAWVIKVAWNEAKMVWRRQARVELGEVPERPDGVDPAAAILSRIELAAVLDALPALTVDQRNAIASALVDDAECPLTPAVKMRRHRARLQLASLAADRAGYPSNATSSTGSRRASADRAPT